MLEVGGTSLWEPNREIDFGFGSCRACGRGEAAWAGERNDPAVARAKSRQMSLPPGGVGCPGVSRECPAVSRGCPAGVPPVRCEIDSEIACKIECEIECEIDR